ncbi:hypothetical protein YPPY32_4886, partial [Yersinia pestis PY-32]
MPIRRTPTPF